LKTLPWTRAFQIISGVTDLFATVMCQVRYASLTEAVRLLGCFDTATDIQPASAAFADVKPPAEDTVFSRLFHELATLVSMLRSLLTHDTYVEMCCCACWLFFAFFCV